MASEEEKHTEDQGEEAVRASSTESVEDVKARHRREVKSLEGERRSAVKKAKGTAGKGKKGKDAITAVEKEYDDKEKAMAERHAVELVRAESGTGGTAGAVAEEQVADDGNADEDDGDHGMTPQERKRAKAQRKREKAREKERQREAQIEEEKANAGPSRRDREIQIMNELYLGPRHLAIKEIQADGNCLYRAVADQLDDGRDYKTIRSICADVLESKEEDYAPFAELEGSSTYADYVNNVRNSSEWGGHLELRALSEALGRSIVVYSSEATPLTIGDSSSEGGKLQLSFHRHYYALGEHYNSVVREQKREEPI